MLDPRTKSIFETERVDPSIVNKRKRTALMLCFTSPHFTRVAREFGLVRDPDTGLAVPGTKGLKATQVKGALLVYRRGVKYVPCDLREYWMSLV